MILAYVSLFFNLKTMKKLNKKTYFGICGVVCDDCGETINIDESSKHKKECTKAISKPSLEVR